MLAEGRFKKFTRLLRWPSVVGIQPGPLYKIHLHHLIKKILKNEEGFVVGFVFLFLNMEKE